MQKDIKKTPDAARPVNRSSRKAPVSRSAAAQRARAAALKKKKQQQNMLLILGIAAAAVLILILCLVIGCSGSSKSVRSEPGKTNTVVSSVTPEPTPLPDKVKLLPVITQGPTDRKQIVITIDDLNEVDNLNEVIELCRSYGAKLTLFPIGSVIMNKVDLQVLLKKAHDLGYEIENHTFSHKNLYSLTAEEMAEEIYRQNMAVNMALGVEYEMHFLRMPGGNGEKDARSHQYLNQLGTYKGVANWGYSGSDASVSHIKKALQNGQIYLFHAKADDLKKLREFIPYVYSQGYEIVTLNEMFGYEENRVSPLKGDAMSYPVPEPVPFYYTELEYVSLGERQYKQMYAIQLLQNRLISLGYLPPDVKVDGDYGFLTKAAVELFQQENGLTADGFAGKKTQAVLFSDSAKKNTRPAVSPSPTPESAQTAAPK